MKKEMNLIGTLSACQICLRKNLETILPLGHQALTSSYLNKTELQNPELTYPLNFCRCPNCGLVQLDYIAEPSAAFPLNYSYRTGMTNMLIRNFRSLADLIIRDYNVKPGDLVIDIGSNDGTLLQGFKAKGMRVVGVEPTNMAEIANKNGIPTIQEFFSQKVARRIIAKQKKAKVIAMTNTFAHVNKLFELVEGIKDLLTEDGIFVSESQYLLETVKKSQFDCIYHDHLRFYSLKPLIKLFSSFGMSIIDAESIPAAGGSLRVYAQKGRKSMSQQAKKLLTQEKAAGLYDAKELKKFAQKAHAAKNELLKLLLECKKNGKKIVGIGSPARSNTLLSFCKIDKHLLNYTCEKKGSPKIGLFTPGTHIPVVDEAILFKEQPEYALMLSWHIGEELMALMRKLGYKGKFIMPLPKPRIIS
ncbi:MAG: hypothetical protein UW11_C0033G0009 [Parcubacteria group bacterium GW2011_GWA2_43_9b]|uniref:Methyltransferase n=1 Tax=Candidatus Portnoybacteria bacterium RIFCSPLOWO2_02_FULL_39_11 TaxID=1802001 RepID=A0A1G2FP52_9BACT|nr:MAG: hypothetical protein UW11_C0033G0009 [Parcubacteria group bacterium GW2011_GWA2_43_9b]OGZ39572.1 MAG: hypothetical protein A3B04_00705 [Candidatus Portnoybacteria bacterium RIFCSPLOWO2_02_FULL_39_11]